MMMHYDHDENNQNNRTIDTNNTLIHNVVHEYNAVECYYDQCDHNDNVDKESTSTIIMIRIIRIERLSVVKVASYFLAIFFYLHK